MSTQDLRAKYGAPSTNSRKLVNAAIRAELAGGPEALDTLDELRRRSDTPQSNVGRLALAGVRRIVYAMVAEIRRRYGMPPEEDREE